MIDSLMIILNVKTIIFLTKMFLLSIWFTCLGKTLRNTVDEQMLLLIATQTYYSTVVCIKQDFNNY